MTALLADLDKTPEEKALKAIVRFVAENQLPALEMRRLVTLLEDAQGLDALPKEDGDLTAVLGYVHENIPTKSLPFHLNRLAYLLQNMPKSAEVAPADAATNGVIAVAEPVAAPV